MKWNFKCRIILIFDNMMQLKMRMSHLSTFHVNIEVVAILEISSVMEFAKWKRCAITFFCFMLKVQKSSWWKLFDFFLKVANCNELIFTEEKDQTLKLLHYFRNTYLQDISHLVFSEIFSSLTLARRRLCIVKPLKMSSTVVSLPLPQNFSPEKYIYTLFISHFPCLGSGCWGALSIRHQICHVYHISNGPEAIYYRL